MSTSSTKINYKNPPIEVGKRAFYGKESKEFKSMMSIIHEELSTDKLCVVKYCANYHIILTRAGFQLHQNCENVFTSASLAGILVKIFF